MKPLLSPKRVTALILCVLMVFAVVSASAETRKISSGRIVRLREEPSAKGRVINAFPKGTVVNVLSRGDTWCRVKVKEEAGYMMTRYLYPGGGSNGTGGTGGPVMYVWTPSGSTLNLREEANDTSMVLGTYRPGTEVTVLKKGRSWSKVSVGGKTGYMFTYYLRNTR